MISDVLAEANEKMHKAVEVARDDFGSVRTGRANPADFNNRAAAGRRAAGRQSATFEAQRLFSIAKA